MIFINASLPGQPCYIRYCGKREARIETDPNFRSSETIKESHSRHAIESHYIRKHNIKMDHPFRSRNIIHYIILHTHRQRWKDNINMILIKENV